MFVGTELQNATQFGLSRSQHFLCQKKTCRSIKYLCGGINILLRNLFLVRVERLELPRLAAPEPKSGVSTNFTIPADMCHVPDCFCLQVGNGAFDLKENFKSKAVILRGL